MTMRPFTRRTLLLTGAAGAVSISTPRPRAAEAREPASDRPNIVCLVAEDTTAGMLGPYGDPLARTPTLDRLAAEGIRYTNAFSSAPVCAPTRFGLITGLEATSCGPAQHQRASGNIPQWLRGFPSFLREAGYYCTNSGKEDYNAPVDVRDTWDESSGGAHWRDRPPGTPFFSVFNVGESHEGSVHLWEAGSLPVHTDPADVRLPAYLPDAPQLRRDRAVFYDQLARMDARVGARLAQLDEDGLTDDTIVVFYADHGGVLPRSKRFCYDSGLHIPLIVRFPQRFAHLAPVPSGKTVADLVTSLDLPPTIISLAGLDVPGYMQGRVLTGPASDAPPEYVFSFRDRMDERYDMSRTVRGRRFRYVRNYLPYLIPGHHNGYMFRQLGYQEWQRLYREGGLNDHQAAFWREKPTEELYDLHDDPDELNNLASDDRYRRTLDRMSTALDEHMLAVNDNGFIPEGSPLEGYEQSRAPGAYPLGQVLEVAGVAARRNQRHLARLVEWLDHDNEVVRYWAALGCAMLRGAAGNAARALIRRLGDDSPSVRVVAAEAVCRLGRTDSGLPVLTGALLEHQDHRVRLQAANALDRLGALAAPALGALVRAQSDPDKEVARAASHTRLVLTGQYPLLPNNPDGLSIDAPRNLSVSEPVAVTVVLAADGPPARTDVRLRLRAPDGWTVEPAPSTDVHVQPPGNRGSLRASFRITAPADAEGRGALLIAEATYRHGGDQVVMTHGATVALSPYVSLAQAFNDVGITDGVGGTAGTLTRRRDSFAAEALANQGLTPGTRLSRGGVAFTWPAAAPGFPNNVRCRHQVIDLHGQGSRLGFLGFSVGGTHHGTGEIHYEDGTSDRFVLGLTDWRRDEPAAGNELVAHTDYTYRRGRREQISGNVFLALAPLNADRTPRAVVLPDNVDMHLFAIGLG